MSSRSNRVEFIAIPVVLVVFAILFGLMLAADAGAWACVTFTTALVVLGLVAIGWAISRRRHPPVSDAPATTRRRRITGGATYQVLVLADESLAASAFEQENRSTRGRPAGRGVRRRSGAALAARPLDR